MLFSKFVITVRIQTNKMHKILVIRLYFPLDALHVSDSVSTSSGAIFYKLYIAFGISQKSHTTARRMVPALPNALYGL